MSFPLNILTLVADSSAYLAVVSRDLTPPPPESDKGWGRSAEEAARRTAAKQQTTGGKTQGTRDKAIRCKLCVGMAAEAKPTTARRIAEAGRPACHAAGLSPIVYSPISRCTNSEGIIGTSRETAHEHGRKYHIVFRRRTSAEH